LQDIFEEMSTQI